MLGLKLNHVSKRGPRGYSEMECMVFIHKETWKYNAQSLETLLYSASYSTWATVCFVEYVPFMIIPWHHMDLIAVQVTGNPNVYVQFVQSSKLRKAAPGRQNDRRTVDSRRQGPVMWKASPCMQYVFSRSPATQHKINPIVYMNCYFSWIHICRIL